MIFLTPFIIATSPSLSEFKKALEKLKSTPIDYINYNPEVFTTHKTPPEELNDLVGTVKNFHLICDKLGAKLSFVPDKAILKKYTQVIAPLVNMFGIQIQRYQRGRNFLITPESLIRMVREVNPDIPIFIQVSMSPPVWKGEKLLRDERGKNLLKPMKAEEVLKQIEYFKNLVEGGSHSLYQGNSCGDEKLILMFRGPRSIFPLL